MRKIQIIWAALASLAVAGPALAAEEHREMGAHVHGHGKLNIAIEGKRVEMELEVPGADIVGFEHDATTPQQKDAVEIAKVKLGDVDSLVELPNEAKCRSTKGDANLKLDDEHDKHEGHKHGSKKPAAQHSEFHGHYVFECEAPEQITSIKFKYFDVFPKTRELDVNVVTATAQNHYEVTRKKPTIKLAK